MADDKNLNDKNDSNPDFSTDAGKESSDSGLGNLPPLSDFESGDMDSGLPPLGSFDSGPGDEAGRSGDETVLTPAPSPQNMGEFDTPMSDSGFDTPTSDGGIDTPEPTPGTGFQDLTADSDFSPETPEIGPGPDSDIETPLFDSAFGGGESPAPSPDLGFDSPATPAVGGGDAFAFDEGAFGADTGSDMGMGTPVPDFSPDTGVGAGGEVPAEPAMAAATAGPPPKKKKGGGILGMIIAAVVALAIGVLVGPFIPGLPNPAKGELSDLQTRYDQLDRKYRDAVAGPKAPTGEVLNTEELAKEFELLKTNVQQKTTEYEKLSKDVEDRDKELNDVTAELTAKRDEYETAQDLYEDLLNRTTVEEAKRNGLLAEVDRLSGLVGELEEADVRRMASKDALKHNVNRLAITIREGIPLTPAKYDRSKRIAAVERLGTKIDAAKWVEPALVDEYTDLYNKELEIAQARDYFFARIKVTDRYGIEYIKWAECLMNGNWSVYYRSLDGKNIGSYENVAESGTPQFAFREELPDLVKKEIDGLITASRPDDFEARVKMVAKKQLVLDDRSEMQRAFDSL